jgi:NAD(P)-dependent dehydrogenase (short-subunit alcohol dehydrogenase family)
MSQSLQGKVAIVTGGSRGIGRAVCQGLAAEGCGVVVTSRTEVDESADSQFRRHSSGTIHKTAQAIQQRGGQSLAVKCDLSYSNDIRRLVDATLEHFGRIDILVSNAGIDCESPVPDLELEALDQCLALNIRAPMLLCKYALPAMIDQGSGGSIFAVTSGAARGYRPGRVGYSMSKAALDRMFLSLAEEVRPHNMAVNLFSPGRVDTWMNRNGDWPGTAHIPMVLPDEVIPAAVWLAKQTAETFTGQWVERAEFGETWGDVSHRSM